MEGRDVICSAVKVTKMENIGGYEGGANLRCSCAAESPVRAPKTAEMGQKGRVLAPKQSFASKLDLAIQTGKIEISQVILHVGKDPRCGNVGILFARG